MSRIYQSAKSTTAPVNTPVLSANNSKSPSPAPVKSENSENNQQHVERMEKLVARLESIAARLENTSVNTNIQTNGKVAAEAAVVIEADKPSIIAFNDLLNGALNTFFTLSDQIGGDVKTIVSSIKNEDLMRKC